MPFGMGGFVQMLNYVVANPIILLGFLAAYVALFLFSVWYSKQKKPGPNPFAHDSARVPGPLVTDSKVRDRVLKQGFHIKKLPEKADVIVIGSGIGGLTAANILARAGKRVVVLEQHDQAGGCCHTFVDKGFEFDVGIHYIGEMRNNTVSKLLVDQMTDGQLVWEDLDEEMDVVAIGEPGKASRYSVMTGRDAWRKELLKTFPSDAPAIDKFFKLLQEVRLNVLGYAAVKTMRKWILKLLIKFGFIGFMTKYFSFSKKSLKQTLDELTDNEQLKAVLSYSFGDYGTMPGDSSFTMHAILLNHYLHGGSYPRGGASEFAFHMIPPIEKAGGKVVVRAPVSSIVMNSKGRAIGVKVERGGIEIELNAPLIISDAGVLNTFCKLLPREIAIKSPVYDLINKTVKSGAGAMNLFVGLKGTAEELGLKAQNIWAFTGNDLHGLAKKYINMSVDEAMSSEVPLLFISFPSTKDSSFNERYPGKTVCTVVTLANWDWFKDWEEERVQKRGPEYMKIKNNIGDRMWEQVVAIYPQLKDKVEFMEVGSPLSNKYYIAAPKGEAYGLDHNTERFANPEVAMTLRPDVDIPGLFLTGQDVFSCGFMGAIMGGVLCGSRLLHRNLWQDLVELKKSISKNK